MRTPLLFQALSPGRYGSDIASLRLEQRALDAERRCKAAEERSQQNESLLNHKMIELSKMQGTLTQQTKVR